MRISTFWMMMSLVIFSLILPNRVSSEAEAVTSTTISPRRPVTEYLRQMEDDIQGVLVQPELVPFYLDNRQENKENFSDKWNSLVNEMFQIDVKEDRIGKVRSWLSEPDPKKQVFGSNKLMSRIRHQYPIDSIRRRDPPNFQRFYTADLMNPEPHLTQNSDRNKVRPEILQDIKFLRKWHDQFGQLFSTEKFENKGQAISQNYTKTHSQSDLGNSSDSDKIDRNQVIEVKVTEVENITRTSVTADGMILEDGQEGTEESISNMYFNEALSKEIPSLEAHISIVYPDSNDTEIKDYERRKTIKVKTNNEDRNIEDYRHKNEYDYFDHSSKDSVGPYVKNNVENLDPYIASDPYNRNNFENSKEKDFNYKDYNGIYRKETVEPKRKTSDFPTSDHELHWYTQDHDYDDHPNVKQSFADKRFTPHEKIRYQPSTNQNTNFYISQAKKLYRNPSYPGQVAAHSAGQNLKNKVISSPNWRTTRVKNGIYRRDRIPIRRKHYHQPPPPKDLHLVDDKQGIANEYLTISGIALASALAGYIFFNSAGSLISRENENPMEFIVNGASNGLHKLSLAIDEYEDNLEMQENINSTLTNSPVDESTKLKMKQEYEVKLEKNKQNITKIFNDFFVRMTTELKTKGHGSTVGLLNNTVGDILPNQKPILDLKDQPAALHVNLRNISKSILKNDLDKPSSAIINNPKKEVLASRKVASDLITSNKFNKLPSIGFNTHHIGTAEAVDDTDSYYLSKSRTTTTALPKVVMSKILTFVQDLPKVTHDRNKVATRRVIINNQEKLIPKNSIINQHQLYRYDITEPSVNIYQNYNNPTPTVAIGLHHSNANKSSLRIKSSFPNVNPTRMDSDNFSFIDSTSNNYPTMQYKKVIINNVEKLIKWSPYMNRTRRKRLIENTFSKDSNILTTGVIIKNKIHEFVVDKLNITK